MSIHMQLSFASEADGLEIYGLEIIPEGDVRGGTEPERHFQLVLSWLPDVPEGSVV